MLNKAQLLAIAVAVATAATAWMGHLAAQCTNETNGCGDCTWGHFSSRSYLGGIECEHGPEYDEDCDENDPNCCELLPGGCTGAAGECSCFACGQNGTCEGEFRSWLCHCGRCSTEGFEPPEPGGTCADCVPYGDEDAILEEQRDMTGPCDSGENFW